MSRPRASLFAMNKEGALLALIDEKSREIWSAP